MPAAPFPRQAAVPAWFAMESALAMRELEHRSLFERLNEVPVQPWLWLAPNPDWLPGELPQGRGLRLYPCAGGSGYDGDLRCSLPLPLPGEALKTIVLQHVAAEQMQALVAECARVLMPGGRLWMTLLNRCSPYRAHWQWHDARPPSAGRCRMQLRGEGLQCTAVHHLGPLLGRPGVGNGRSLPALRAVCLLAAEKRAVPLTGVGQLRSADWRRPLAT